MKHIVVGGVAGGATAAARIRRADEKAEIIIFERGHYISYANCGLPYYIGGTISDRERLFVHTPETFSRQFNIDVRVDSEVLSIDTAGHSVEVRRADGKVYSESYDRLLLSPGASPVRPPLEGIDLDGVFTLRNVNDTDKIKEYIGSHCVKRAVVVGGGFIGLEMAENLHHAGASVSVVEMGNQVMAPVDFSTASLVHQHLIQKGVALYLEHAVEKFVRSASGIEVHFKNGGSISADIVILSIGVRPETSLAVAAGLRIGETKGIWVDEYLQTSAEDVYAVGDAIEYPHPITGKPWLNYLAGPANRQGRIVADNMVFGNKTKYEGAIGTSIAKVFDMTVASAGLPAKRLKQMGINYASSVTHSSSHAGYYPGALPLTVKLTFDPVSGRLYGAQCVGFDGVDKRIDQLALFIKNGATVADLTRLEHAYAPPYSSAKDPVAIAGYAASNIVSGAMKIVTWRDVVSADKSKVALIDVRTPDEFAFGTIEGAVNIPLQQLRERLSEIPSDRTVYLFCAVGLRGYLAQRILFANGFTDVWNLSGGYRTYSAAAAPVCPPSESCCTPDAKQSACSASSSPSVSVETVKIDACGLQCPGPVMKVRQAIDKISDGQRVAVVATDPGFSRDAEAWCKSTGNRLISITDDHGRFKVLIEKGTGNECRSVEKNGGGHGKTFIMFSDDLDKALATFVLANGAAATGQKVTVFFTFWGLNVIKKKVKPAVKKDFFGRMFDMMLPSSSLKLRLSKFSMFGLGGLMMRHIMDRKGIDSLENLRRQALNNGVEFIACQMSMDVMGISREELLDEVEVGGVATYMERAENADVNLFI